jgi:hypothetical protein
MYAEQRVGHSPDLGEDMEMVGNAQVQESRTSRFLIPDLHPLAHFASSLSSG